MYVIHDDCKQSISDNMKRNPWPSFNSGSCILLVFAIFVIGVIVMMTSAAFTTLYTTQDDNILILDDSNFTSILSNKSSAFLVEFYNSWCGHCIRFAPIFKEFATALKPWAASGIMKIAVIDCAEDRNHDVCREYSIVMYPCMRYFHPHYTPLRDFSLPKEDHDSSQRAVNDTQLGMQYDGDLDAVESVRRGIIDFLVKTAESPPTPEIKRTVDETWPYLFPINASSKNEMIRFLHQERKIKTNLPIVVFITNNITYIGLEFLLELSPFQSKVIVIGVDGQNKHLVEELRGDIKGPLPLLLEIDASNYAVKEIKVPDLKSSSDVTSLVKAVAMKYHLNIHNEVKTEHPHERGQDHDVADQIKRPVSKTKGEEESNTVVNSPIYMTDLYNALRYSIYNQITMRSNLNSTQLTAFQGFLRVVNEYFPFPEEDSKASGFIQLLTKWSQTKDHLLSIDDLTAEMAQFEDDFGLPDMKPYRGCAGSSSRFRGYPCSLWILFHALTVNEYLKEQSTQLSPHSVLPAMREFILNFFGCTDCAAHFRKESEGLEEALVHSNSSVLWLWKTHNRVNARLAGDQTEDPFHRKVQFPPKTMCLQCHSHKSYFNEKEVFQFLVNRFQSENIVKDQPKSSKGITLNYRSHPRHVYDHDHEHSWSYDEPLSPTRHITALLSRTDITLFVFLYVFSVTLLVSLFLYFKFKGGRGKKKVPYYQLSNPNIKYMA